MKRTLMLLAACVLLASCGQGGPDVRDFDLAWTVQVENIPAGAAEAKVWITLPLDLPEQVVSNLEVKTDYSWKIVEDPEFKNKAVLVTAKGPPSQFAVNLAADVRRYPVSGPRPASLTPDERELYLREEALVSLSDRLQELANKVGPDHRARYDYIRELMEYDKTVPGWGYGDSERACDVRKGNCTDYHSLFMSLCRAQDVPAVFEMGYPTKTEGEMDREGGYHCWAWFYRDGAWVAVDISEADKNPEKADFFFGSLDPDRISFSRGRDVKFPGMMGPALNYLPSSAYVEVDGRPFDEMVRKLTYKVEASGKEAAL